VTDISEHASIKTELPPAIQRCLDAAGERGWELTGPGLTFTVQFEKPSDPMALPVYGAWTVGRTDSGKLSYRFQSSGTSGLHPLNSKDLIAYLEDPTVVYPDKAPDSDPKALEPQAQPTIPTPVLKPAQSRSGLRVTIPKV
jgi:hypothetical protein